MTEEARVDLMLLRNEEREKSHILEMMRSDREMTQLRGSAILEYWRGVNQAVDELEYKSTVDKLAKSLENDIAGLKDLQQSLTMRMEVEGVTEQLAMTQQLLTFLSRILDKVKRRRRELSEEASLNFLLLNSAFIKNKIGDDKDKDKGKDKRSKEAQREGRVAKAKEPEARPGAKGMTR